MQSWVDALHIPTGPSSAMTLLVRNYRAQCLLISPKAEGGIVNNLRVLLCGADVCCLAGLRVGNLGRRWRHLCDLLSSSMLSNDTVQYLNNSQCISSLSSV